MELKSHLSRWFDRMFLWLLKLTLISHKAESPNAGNFWNVA